MAPSGTVMSRKPLPDHPMRLTGGSRGRMLAESGCNMCGGSDDMMHDTHERIDGRLRQGFVCHQCLPKFHEQSKIWEADHIANGHARDAERAKKQAEEEAEEKAKQARREANHRMWEQQEKERKIREANIQAEALSIAARAREQQRLKDEFYAAQSSQNGIF